MPEFHAEAPQATVSYGLAQGPYVTARAGVEPTTLRLKAIDSTNAPSRHTSVPHLIRTLSLLGPNSLCFLCLGFFSLQPFLQHLCLSSASFCSLRWLEFFRLRDYSAQPHRQVISIFNHTSPGQYSSGSTFVLSLSDSLLSYLTFTYTIELFQQCNKWMVHRPTCNSARY